VHNQPSCECECERVGAVQRVLCCVLDLSALAGRRRWHSRLEAASAISERPSAADVYVTSVFSSINGGEGKPSGTGKRGARREKEQRWRWALGYRISPARNVLCTTTLLLTTLPAGCCDRMNEPKRVG
jgi:hypothetical protein